MADIKLSEKLELIIGILDQCKTDHTWYVAQLAADEKKGNTLRHELEGVGVEHRAPPGYKERARIATDLQTALIARRISKDHVALNEPIVDFLDSDIGKTALKQLRQKLGETRKVESKMVDRIFYRRHTENTAPENPELKKSLDRLIRDWKRKRSN